MIPKGFVGMRNDAKRTIRDSGKYLYLYNEDRLIVSDGFIALDVTSVMGPLARTTLHTELLNLKGVQAPTESASLDQLLSRCERAASEELIDSKVRLLNGSTLLTVLVPADPGTDLDSILVRQRHLHFAEKMFGKGIGLKATSFGGMVTFHKGADFVGVAMAIDNPSDHGLIPLFKRAAAGFKTGGGSNG